MNMISQLIASTVYVILCYNLIYFINLGFVSNVCNVLQVSSKLCCTNILLRKIKFLGVLLCRYTESLSRYALSKQSVIALQVPYVPNRTVLVCIRVERFSTFFYHLLVFHELDLLVLRPFVKKIFYLPKPHRVHALAVFKTCRATGSLIIRARFRNFENIFTKDQRILETKIRNSKFFS